MLVLIVLIKLQLDWPSIAGCVYAGMFAVAIRFQIRDQFWISQPKLNVACFLDLFEKSKDELVRTKMVFLTILAKI